MDDEALAWQVLERTTAYECSGFRIEREEVRLPDGTETAFDYLVEPPSVVILPFTATDEIVLIREWREAVDRVNRGLPAGTAEPDDPDLAATARRELREETGYAAGEIEPLLTVEPANGVANIEHHYFLAHECEPSGAQALEPDESIAVETACYDDVLAAALAGEMRDGRAMLGLLYYHLARG